MKASCETWADKTKLYIKYQVLDQAKPTMRGI